MIEAEGKKVIALKKQIKEAADLSVSEEEDDEEEAEDDDAEEEMEVCNESRGRGVSKSAVKKGKSVAVASKGLSRGGGGRAGGTVRESCLMEMDDAPAPDAMCAAPSFNSASTTAAASASFVRAGEALEFDEDGADDDLADALEVAATLASEGDQQQHGDDASGEDEMKKRKVVIPAIPWTQFPVSLDRACEDLGTDAASLCSTKIEVGPTWKRSSCANILAEPVVTDMGEPEQRAATNEAFDVLDALSRTGVLSFDDAKLHILMIATHNFQASLVDTVVVENVDPIARIEQSMLLVAKIVHTQCPDAAQLLKPEHRPRLQAVVNRLQNSSAVPTHSLMA